MWYLAYYAPVGPLEIGGFSLYQAVPGLLKLLLAQDLALNSRTAHWWYIASGSNTGKWFLVVQDLANTNGYKTIRATAAQQVVRGYLGKV